MRRIETLGHGCASKSWASVLVPTRSTLSALPGMIILMTEGDDADVERAPICPSCGVTTLPADTSNVLDSNFVCENPDCDAFGDAVES